MISLEDGSGKLPVTRVYSHDGTEHEISKVVVWDSEAGEKTVYPAAADRISITTDYDHHTRVKKPADFPYAYPVIVPAFTEYHDIHLTVTPFPPMAGWYLTSQDFRLGSDEKKVYYGSRTLTIPVPSPSSTEAVLKHITAVPEHGDAEPQVFSFYVKGSTSQGSEADWLWTFSSGMTDMKGGQVLAWSYDPAAAGGGWSSHCTAESEGVEGRALASAYLDGDTDNKYNDFTNSGSLMSNIATEGFSLMCYAKFRWDGRVMFVPSASPERWSFGFKWSYYTAECRIVNTDNSSWRAWGSYAWQHMATTFSAPQTPFDPACQYTEQNHEGWVVEDSGKIHYRNDWLNYTSDTFNITASTPASTYSLRLQKFYFNGLLADMTAENITDYTLLKGAQLQVHFNNTTSVTPTAFDAVDEISAYRKELTVDDVRTGAMALGYTFDSDDPTKYTDTPAAPDAIDKRFWQWTPSSDITEETLAPYMKAFVIDSRTIAVGLNFRKFYMERLKDEFPNYDIQLFNTRDSKYFGGDGYEYNLYNIVWEYCDLILDDLEKMSEWYIDGTAGTATMLGRWHNVCGLWRWDTGELQYQNAQPGTPYYVTPKPSTLISFPDVAQFVYLRLASPLQENTTHTLKWKDRQISFTYGPAQYNSAIKVNQEGYAPWAVRRYAYFGMWLGSGGRYEKFFAENAPFYLRRTCDGATVFTGTIVYRNKTDDGSSGSMTMPLEGERVHEMDFSSFSSVTKAFITWNGTTYFRDPPMDDSSRTWYAWSYRPADFSSTQTVYTSTASPSAGAYVYGDFNAFPSDSYTVTATGTGTTHDISDEYQVYVPDVGWSHRFLIHQKALGKMFWVHMRGLFHQRSGCPDVKPPYTNWTFERAAHPWTWQGVAPTYDSEIGLLRYTSDGGAVGGQWDLYGNTDGELRRDVRGGWYDAADFDRRTFHMKAIRDLCDAYLMFPQNFTDGQLDLPESGDGIPDILSEAMWGIRIYYSGQYADGAVSGWIETYQHEHDMPWTSTLPYTMGVHNCIDSVKYATIAAKLARGLKLAGTPEALKWYMRYADSAARAFRYGVTPANRHHVLYFKGRQCTYDETASLSTDEIFDAACALYALTGDAYYRQFITAANFEASVSRFAGQDDPWAYMQGAWHTPVELMFDFPEILPEKSSWLRQYVIDQADLWIDYQESHPYRRMLWPPRHGNYYAKGWGNGHPDARARLYIWAWRLTGDTKYRDEALLAMDYMTGCNGMGRTYTTRLGKVYPVHHLQHWLWYAEPMYGKYEDVPGITIYGDYKADVAYAGPTCWAFTPELSDNREYGFLHGYDITFIPKALSRARMGGYEYRETILNHRWPGDRRFLDMEDLDVPESEFTVHETIASKAALMGCLMGTGFRCDPSWKNWQPATGRESIEGYVYLP